MESDEKRVVFLRSDLEETNGVTAYYRLPDDIKKFLNLCLKKHGEIRAITLDLKENGYGYNIGFVLPEPKEKNIH